MGLTEAVQPFSRDEVQELTCQSDCKLKRTTHSVSSPGQMLTLGQLTYAVGSITIQALHPEPLVSLPHAHKLSRYLPSVSTQNKDCL